MSPQVIVRSKVFKNVIAKLKEQGFDVGFDKKNYRIFVRTRDLNYVKLDIILGMVAEEGIDDPIYDIYGEDGYIIVLLHI